VKLLNVASFLITVKGFLSCLKLQKIRCICDDDMDVLLEMFCSFLLHVLPRNILVLNMSNDLTKLQTYYNSFLLHERIVRRGVNQVVVL
jgi:hypothetical protein